MYTDQKTARYELTVKRFAVLAMRGRQRLTGPVEIEFTARITPAASASKRDKAGMLDGEIQPTKKPDADNILKVADALKKICFEDDAQVVRATVTKIYAAEAGLDIVVRPFAGGRQLILAAE